MGKKESGFLLAPCGVRGVDHVVLGCVREMSDCAGRLDGGGWGEGAPLILFTFFSGMEEQDQRQVQCNWFL